MIALLPRQFIAFDFFSKNFVEMREKYAKARRISLGCFLFIIGVFLTVLSISENFTEFDVSLTRNYLMLLVPFVAVYANLGPFFALVSKFHSEHHLTRIFGAFMVVKLVFVWLVNYIGFQFDVQAFVLVSGGFMFLTSLSTTIFTRKLIREVAAGD